MKKILWLALLSAMSLPAVAQTADDAGQSSDAPPRFGLGVGVVADERPYAGEGTRTIPFPLVSYNGERFYYMGDTVGWRFIKGDAFELSAVGKLRIDGFDAEDLGRRELAANGINRDLLNDRDFEFDIGLGLRWTGKAGEFSAQFVADATNTSDGDEANFEYAYPIEAGRGNLRPLVGFSVLSDRMANYYYGTLKKEVARGVVDYRPGEVVIPYAGIQYMQPIGEKWSFMAFARYNWLPEEITDSPLVEEGLDGTGTVFVGFWRNF